MGIRHREKPNNFCWSVSDCFQLYISRYLSLLITFFLTQNIRVKILWSSQHSCLSSVLLMSSSNSLGIGLGGCVYTESVVDQTSKGSSEQQNYIQYSRTTAVPRSTSAFLHHAYYGLGSTAVNCSPHFSGVASSKSKCLVNFVRMKT